MAVREEGYINLWWWCVMAPWMRLALWHFRFTISVNYNFYCYKGGVVLDYRKCIHSYTELKSKNLMCAKWRLLQWSVNTVLKVLYLSLLTLHAFHITEYICYDDGCHLRKYTQNLKRKNLTVTSQKLASLSIYVDKLHIKGHTDPWCLENCDARNVEDLNDVSCNHLK